MTAPAFPCRCGHDRRDHDEWGWGPCLACKCERFGEAPKLAMNRHNFIPLTAQERIATRLVEDAPSERIFTLPDVPQYCPACRGGCGETFRSDVPGGGPSTIWCSCGATLKIEPGYRPQLETAVGTEPDPTS